MVLHCGFKWASLVAQMVKIPPAVWETWVQSLGWEDSLKRAWQSTPVFLPGEFHGWKSPAGHSPGGQRFPPDPSSFMTNIYNIILH